MRVRAGNNAGSGTLIHVASGKGVVLTAGHVVGQSTDAVITWPEGTESTGRVLGVDRDGDLGAVQVAVTGRAMVVPLAGPDGWPPRSAVVELCGYGGSGPRMRHWQATVDGYAKTSNSEQYHTLQVRSSTISGDSGGCVLYRGRLVGVIWGGPNRTADGRVHPVRATCCVRIRRFLRQVHPGCLPPTRPPAQPDVAPPSAPTECPSRPGDAHCKGQLLALQRQIEQLTEQVSQLEKTPGPAGRQGPPGRDATLTDEQLHRLAGMIQQQLRGSIRVRIEPVTQR